MTFCDAWSWWKQTVGKDNCLNQHKGEEYAWTRHYKLPAAVLRPHHTLTFKVVMYCSHINIIVDTSQLCARTNSLKVKYSFQLVPITIFLHISPHLPEVKWSLARLPGRYRFNCEMPREERTLEWKQREVWVSVLFPFSTGAMVVLLPAAQLTLVRYSSLHAKLVCVYGREWGRVELFYSLLPLGYCLM